MFVSLSSHCRATSNVKISSHHRTISIVQLVLDYFELELWNPQSVLGYSQCINNIVTSGNIYDLDILIVGLFNYCDVRERRKIRYRGQGCKWISNYVNIQSL